MNNPWSRAETLMVRVSSDDQRWVRNVLMPYFHIKALRLHTDPSTKKWPDLWCRTGADGIPVVTVTAEWGRQAADERRKRLVHEALHIADGLKDEAVIFGDLFSTYPEKDTYSRKIYRLVQQWAKDRADFAMQRRMKEAGRLLGRPVSKAAYRKEMEARGVKLDEYDLFEQKSGALLRNPDSEWHWKKAQETEREADKISPTRSATPVSEHYDADRSVPLDERHRLYRVIGRHMGHVDSAYAAEDSDWWPEHDREFHREAMKRIQRLLQEVVSGSPRFGPPLQRGLEGSYLKGVIDAHRESRKEMWDRYKSWRSQVNPRRRTGPKKPSNLYEEYLVENARKWDWNAIVRLLRQKQANMARVGVRVKPRYYLGNQMEIGPWEDYYEPSYNFSPLGYNNPGYRLAQWLEALITIAGLHNLAVFRPYSDPADIYVEPGVVWRTGWTDDDTAKLAAEVGDLVGDEYVRQIEQF